MVDLSVSSLSDVAQRRAGRALSLAPGLIVAAAVACGALMLQMLEVRLVGRAWLEALVLAIVLGSVVRTLWSPPAQVKAGVCFAAKPVLEAAVVLLGASVSASALAGLGLPLLGGTVALVAVAIGVGYGVARLIGVPKRMAVLIACGNAICGNSAIAAIAPVIDAEGKDVAASIGFTAILGVVTVLMLPAAAGMIGYGPAKAGVLAGLTVYAVPQVLAAASPFGAAAIQTGAIVKLARVLMLGPVCFVLASLFSKGGKARAGAPPVPWFILGFAALMGARSFGLLPQSVVAVSSVLSTGLTLVAMAGLGLSTDFRQVTAAGPRAALAGGVSLLALGVLAVGLIGLIGIR